MPRVTLDQNQEIHIRGEHLGIQYQMNGILLPLDINTDPTFTQLLNSFFVKSVSLLDGILPARYGYRTADVIDIVTKNGCEQPGGNFSLLSGQRSTVEPSFQLGGSDPRTRLAFFSLHMDRGSRFTTYWPYRCLHSQTSESDSSIHRRFCARDHIKEKYNPEY